MQVTETLSEGLKRGFAVTLPAAELEGKRAAKLQEIGRSVKLPGFRPGKVPGTIVKQRFGTAVMAEVLEEAVNDATRKVFDERGLRPAGQPKVDVKEVGDGKDLEFTVECELMPEIAMPDFAGLSLTRFKAEAQGEAVDKALGEIASRNEGREPVTEDRGARTGDTLTVDFVGKVDGVAFEGGTGTGMAVKLGGEGFIPGFSEGMEGMKPGEERTIDVTFPAEYHAAELAGKPATFELKATALEQSVLAAVDDALAEKIGFGTLDEMRDYVKGQIEREYGQISRMRLKRDLLDALAKQAEFAVPPTMLEAEFNQIWGRVEADLAAGRGDEEDKAKDPEVLKGEYRAIAERRVRLGLLLAEIGRTNQVQVGQDEMMRAMRAEASRYPGQEGAVMEFFRKNPQAADNLRGPIYEEKVVDYILDQATLEEKVVSPEELSADPEETKAA